MKLIHHAIYFVSCMAIYIGLFWAECQIVPPGAGTVSALRLGLGSNGSSWACSSCFLIRS